ncbi:MAG: peptide ABC transporter permease [Alphaproteobacteria bacterium]|nr:peptide ABC transporter permease [Alphaproteobacteria bacterium]
MSDSGRKRTSLTGEQARQGRIVLKTSMKRMLFFGAFAAIGLFCVLTLIVAVASMAGR